MSGQREEESERAAMASALLSVALGVLALLLQWGSPGREASPSWALHVDAAQTGAPVNLTQLRAESLDMFHHGWSNYMHHAFPKDDLRPLSCRGKNSQGGIGLTLIDALDTLLVMDDLQSFQQAVHWLSANASFHVDARVHVFELTIRALGGLLSAHMLIQADPALVPGYDGSLLRLAVDLTDRLLPAFDTPSGVPLSWVNLAKGQIPGDVRATCTACAGTLLLEFGVLSRLTGNATYEIKARHAVETIYSMRSSRGLVGNTLDCDKGAWVRMDAGVGAGVDSFYEYLLKAYLAFGDESFLSMFADMYSAAITNLQLSHAVNGFVWLIDAHMEGGQLLHPYVWSLGAFWPGLQVLAGQVEEGRALHTNWTSAWRKFGWLPEMFDIQLSTRHPTEGGYPLRPELMESTFLLYSATHDPRLLRTGAALHKRLREKNRAACGYASVGDVTTGRLEDTMESFFLSETVKYLYLLFSNATALVDHFVLSTEGHFFPPFDAVDQLKTLSTTPGASAANETKTSSSGGGGLASETSSSGTSSGSLPGCSATGHASEDSADEAAEAPDPAALSRSENVEEVEAAASEEHLWRRALKNHVAEKCRPFCKSDLLKAQEAAVVLSASMPLVPVQPAWRGLLTQRRCRACQVVTRSVANAKRLKAEQLLHAVPKTGRGGRLQAGVRKGQLEHQLPGVSVSGLPILRQFICHVAEIRPGKLGCARIQEVPPINLAEHTLQALPATAVVLQLTEGPPQPVVHKAAEQEDEEEDEYADPDDEEGEGDEEGGAGRGGEEEEEGEDEGDEEQEKMQLGSHALHQLPVFQAVTLLRQHLDGGATSVLGVLAEFGPAFTPSCAAAEACVGGGSKSASSSIEVGSGVSCAADPEQGYEQQQGESATAACGDPEAHDLGSSSSSSIGSSTGGKGPSTKGSSSAAGSNADSVAPCCLEGRLVVAQPLDACKPLTNAGSSVQGSVVVLKRGNCSFLEKVQHSHEAGAVGVVVLNTEPALMMMGGDGGMSQPGIPAVLVASTDGEALMQAASQGAALRMQAAPKAVQQQLEAQLGREEQERLAQQQQDGGQCWSAGAAEAEAEAAASGSAAAQAAPAVAAAASGDGSGSSKASSQRQSLIELLVPPAAQAWLVQQVVLKKDLGPVFDMLIARLAHENEVPSKGRGAAGAAATSSSQAEDSDS